MREAVPVNTQSLGHFATLPDIERGVQSDETWARWELVGRRGSKNGERCRGTDVKRLNRNTLLA